MKKFNYVKNFNTEARTLSKHCVGNNASGWQVKAQVHEDYYEWVNYFEAFHPSYGLVFGDFESMVFASSDEALENFLKHHPVEEWDYYDI